MEGLPIGGDDVMEGDLLLEGDEFHEQVQVWTGIGNSPVFVPDEFSVDAKIAKVIDRVNALGFRTHESCENYGEYLRHLGFDHVHESKRDYAYIEFYDVKDAIAFLLRVEQAAGVANMIHHKIVQEGTPGAWELKYRWTTGNFWVWFPAEDILELEALLDA